MGGEAESLQLELIEQRHAGELEALRGKYEKQLKTMKSASYSSNHEFTVLQTDLLEEKRKHLATVQELSTCHTKLRELEQ